MVIYTSFTGTSKPSSKAESVLTCDNVGVPASLRADLTLVSIKLDSRMFRKKDINLEFNDEDKRN